MTRELPALGVALALALLVAWHLASSDRSWLIYFDGDSMLPALVQGSIAAGEPQNWALSAPLFIPEMALYLALGLLHLPVWLTLTLNGIANWLALYGAFRFVAGATRDPRAALVAVTSYATVAAMAMLESSADRNSLEGASLLSTGTYYSATVIGSLLTFGVVARSWGGTSRPRALVAGLVLVSALSTLNNPIYLVWCVVPLVPVAALVALTRTVARRQIGISVAAIAAGVAVGMIGRLPFGALIQESAATKVAPGLARSSAGYYAGLLLDLGRTGQGALEVALVAVCGVVGVVVTVHGIRRRDRVSVALGSIAWLVPLVVAVEVVATGTFAARYLQPLFFATPVSLIAMTPLIARVRRPAIARLGPLALVAALVLVLAPGAVRVTPSTLENQASARCVDRWVIASHRIGAGQYWTIRGVKAYLPNPAQLLQTDQALNPYLWLVDTEDYRGVHAVSFVVDSSDAPPIEVGPVPGSTTIHCGRYTITDFGSHSVPLGTAHS